MKPHFLTLAFLIISYGILPSCNRPNDPDPQIDPTPISDSQILDSVQYATFQYFWEGAESNSGMALERIHIDEPQLHKDIVTSGGSGFGIMAILVGIERGFITRAAGVSRLQKITNFLQQADRFHGAWPHWLCGSNGKAKPFSTKDDGGDIVETAFMAQALLCARQYFMDGNDAEKQLAADMDQLWREIDWSWYQNGQEVLYWHWSPNFGWEMNFPITGYNESLIPYILGASSPTYPISKAAYHKGWAKNGAIVTQHQKYGFDLNLSHNGAPEYGGPLFWSHYSYLGLDPRNLKDQYADYWQHNVNHTLINRAYCVENPKNYDGYSEKCWGLTASYSVNGYHGHSPAEDLGVITPTAALSSFPYTPDQSMKVLRYLYEEIDDQVWGKYGPYDAFSMTEDWYPQRYLAIDQGPIIVMIENHRSGLLWDLFMSSPEIKSGLDKLGFTY